MVGFDVAHRRIHGAVSFATIEEPLWKTMWPCFISNFDVDWMKTWGLKKNKNINFTQFLFCNLHACCMHIFFLPRINLTFGAFRPSYFFCFQERAGSTMWCWLVAKRCPRQNSTSATPAATACGTSMTRWGGGWPVAPREHLVNHSIASNLKTYLSLATGVGPAPGPGGLSTLREDDWRFRRVGDAFLWPWLVQQRGGQAQVQHDQKVE